MTHISSAFCRCVFAVMLFSNAVHADTAKTVQPLFTIPVQYGDGRLIIQAAGAGDDLASLVVDTAAQFSMLSAEAVTRLGGVTVRGEMSVHGAGGNIQVQRILIDSIRLGTLVLTEVEAIAMPPGHVLPRGGAELDGVFSLNALQAYDVEIDAAAGMLRLYEPGKLALGPAALPIMSPVPGILGVQVTIDQVQVRAILDTGLADTGIVNWQAAGAAGFSRDDQRITKRSDGTVGLDGNVTETHLAQLDGLRIGPDFPRPGLYRIADLPVFAGLRMDTGPAMLLGARILESATLRIAFASNRVEFVPTAADAGKQTTD